MINFKSKKTFYDNLYEMLKSENSAEYFYPNASSNKLIKTTKFLGPNSLIATGYSHLVLDDLSAYDLFYDNLVQLPEKYSAYDLIRCVQKSVFDYFGYDKPNEAERLLTYKINYDKNIHTSIINFKNTGNSWCLERATLCHNYLKLLGLNSALISSNIELNGNKQLHAYNTLEINGFKYLLDLLNTPASSENIPRPIFERISNNIELFNDHNSIDFGQNYSFSFVSKSGKLYHINYLTTSENKEILSA